MSEKAIIKGYKVFNPDWTCRGFQYEVGKTFKHDGNIEMCGAGFHFCQKASDCFDYYKFDSQNKVAEIEAIGRVETSGNKSVTDEIKIVREIPWQELLTIVNEGNDCTGLCNTGNCNTLIFKWSEVDIPVSEILKIFGYEPLFGHKSGRFNKTHWLCFMKDGKQKKVKTNERNVY